MPVYEVLDVTEWPVAAEETLGSKEKDWLRNPGQGGELWLWKASRGDAGDDWSEKVAEQLANLLRVPHAQVELATRGDSRGVVVRDFRWLAGLKVGDFTPGNELLWNADSTYPKDRKRRATVYTVERSFSVLRELGARPPLTGVHWGEEHDAEDFFVGYLLFDAWIANQDRHHENWGVISMHPGGATPGPLLGPSFDHASSLAQNETDEKRNLRLTTKDKRARIEAWALKARSPFYSSDTPPRPITTMEALAAAAAVRPDALPRWLTRLDGVSDSAVQAVLSALPPRLLSSVGRRFTLTLLDLNRREILNRFRIAP